MWAIAGLLGLGPERAGAPDELVILLRPRVALPSGVRAGDREALAVGTENRLGLRPGE